LCVSQDALEPKISKKTMDLHWGKHHQAYVTNLNGQIKGTELEGKPLTDIIAAGWNGGKPTPFFNNAGQVWNHDFFWASMSPTKSEEWREREGGQG
jgi:Fe-Mn family superoxide dismutase